VAAGLSAGGRGCFGEFRVADVDPLFEIEAQEPATVVRFLRTTHIEVGAAEPLADLLSALKPSSPKGVIVDLSCLEWANSLFLGILVGLYKKLEQKDRKMVVACVPEQIRDMLRLTGLHRLLNIHKNLDEAVAEIGK